MGAGPGSFRFHGGEIETERVWLEQSGFGVGSGSGIGVEMTWDDAKPPLESASESLGQTTRLLD